MWDRILLTVAIALTAVTASAGPWPRDEGATFLSFGGIWTTPRDDLGAEVVATTTLYAERGLPHDLTLGIDAYLDQEDQSSAFLFLRRPVLRDLAPDLFAVRTGVGRNSLNGVESTIVVGGVTWGRGLSTDYGPGWATLDVQLQSLVEVGENVVKADATVGISPTDDWKLIMQAQAGAYPDSDAYLRLAPSVVRQFAPGRHLELGGQIGITGENRLGLSLGTWLEF